MSSDIEKVSTVSKTKELIRNMAFVGNVLFKKGKVCSWQRWQLILLEQEITNVHSPDTLRAQKSSPGACKIRNYNLITHKIRGFNIEFGKCTQNIDNNKFKLSIHLVE